MASLFQRLTRPFTSGTLRFAPESNTVAADPSKATEKATLAAGCFWGIEELYRKNFQTAFADEKDFKDVFADVKVGYIGGGTENPSYRSVCSGRTGHAEACQVEYYPDKVSYRDIIEYFYRIHDPTEVNKQGADTGTQYRTGIFYHNDEQKAIAQEVTKKANEQWWGGKIATEIVPAGKWWDAEDYHQNYLHHTPNGYQCSAHYDRSYRNQHWLNNGAKLQDLQY